tara:strand:- start:699 stop:839 length:141 start_codon:yes stop_codon:yes gene_type:complete
MVEMIVRVQIIATAWSADDIAVISKRFIHDSDSVSRYPELLGELAA